jgi:hypothetical protein
MNSNYSFIILRCKKELGVVARVSNPSYSENGNQEDCGSRPAWGKSLQDPI